MYCDLCIIGGGASGLVAGLSALEKGLEHVVILEKNEGVGKHSSQRIDLCVPDEQFKTIIDTLHIPINHISQLTRWISPSNIVYDFESRIPDYWIKRGSTDDALEPALLDMFLKGGGTILYHQKALTVQSSTNQVKTIIQKETEKTTVFSPAVIMADGGESEKNKNQRIPIIANGFYGENFDIPPGIPYIFFDMKLAYGSYVLLLKNPKTEIGYLIHGYYWKDRQTHPSALFSSLLKTNQLLKKTLKRVNNTTKISGMLYVAKPLRTITNHHVLKTGDAARLMDPLFHYGLKEALMSGYYAGSLAAQSIQDDTIDIIRKYDNLYKQIFHPSLQQGYILRNIFNKLSNKEIDTLFQIIKDLDKTDLNMDDFFDTPHRYLTQIIPLLLTYPTSFRLLPKIFTSLIY